MCCCWVWHRAARLRAAPRAAGSIKADWSAMQLEGERGAWLDREPGGQPAQGHPRKPLGELDIADHVGDVGVGTMLGEAVVRSCSSWATVLRWLARTGRQKTVRAASVVIRRVRDKPHHMKDWVLSSRDGGSCGKDDRNAENRLTSRISGSGCGRNFRGSAL